MNTTCPCDCFLRSFVWLRNTVYSCASVRTNHSRRSACESAEGRRAGSASVRLASVSRPRQRGSAQGRRPSGKVRKSICAPNRCGRHREPRRAVRTARKRTAALRRAHAERHTCRSGAQGRREGVSASRAASCFQGHQILRTHELERAARARSGGTGVTLPVLTRLIPFNTRCLGYCKKKEPATAFRSMTM